jgi:hypothetical protein
LEATAWMAISSARATAHARPEATTSFRATRKISADDSDRPWSRLIQPFKWFGTGQFDRPRAKSVKESEVSRTTNYLKIMMALLLSLAIGGASAATTIAGSVETVAPVQSMFQDDGDDDDDTDDDGPGGDDVDDRDDGTGTEDDGLDDNRDDDGPRGDDDADDVGGDDDAGFAPIPRSVSLHEGTCLTPGAEVASLNNLRSPDGVKNGSDDADRTEYGYTPNVPLSISELVATDHVIIVRGDDDDDDSNDEIIACGAVGGVTDDNGSLVVALGDDDSGTAGIAVFSPNPVDPSTTQASIFIVGRALGDDFGTDDDNDGRVDDDDDDRGRDDDNGPGGDDDGFDDDGPGGDDDGFDDDGPGGDDDGIGDDDGVGGDDGGVGDDDGTGDDGVGGDDDAPGGDDDGTDDDAPGGDDDGTDDDDDDADDDAGGDDDGGDDD